MQYQVLIVESKEGFIVSCPALPGCHSRGATRQEALANIREAIQIWSEDSEDDAKPGPEIDDMRATCELVNV